MSLVNQIIKLLAIRVLYIKINLLCRLVYHWNEHLTVSLWKFQCSKCDQVKNRNKVSKRKTARLESFFFFFWVIRYVQKLKFCLNFLKLSLCKLSLENKRALKPFHHKNYFWYKINAKQTMGALDSFSIKNLFCHKIELKIFLFLCDEI